MEENHHDCSGHQHYHTHQPDPLTEGLFITNEQKKNPMDDPEEQKHFKEIVSAFFNYKNDAMEDIQRIEKNFATIAWKYGKYLKYDYKDKIKRMESCVHKNFLLCCHIVGNHRNLFNFKMIDEFNFEIPPMQIPSRDISKMRSTIRQFVRDWSKNGQAERDKCYKPIIEQFKKYFPEPFVNDRRIKVVFPGSGLGRLVMEFAAMGYGAQGNEFSYFMLLGADYVLNNIDKREEYEIFPWVLSRNNWFEEKDPFEKYLIPDVLPSDLVSPDADFSMVAGEFCEVYRKQKGEWDCVVTCFFIDTAHNVLEYIDTIWDILPENGVWINFGPLLYHYADMQNEVSIELSWEEVKFAILAAGFEIVNEETKSSTYAQEARTMMEVVYNCVFFTAIKRPKKERKTDIEGEKEQKVEQKN